MERLDARGQSCPVPVIRAKKALKDTDLDALEVLVDNPVAVTNLKAMAESLGVVASCKQLDENTYSVLIPAPAPAPVTEQEKEPEIRPPKNQVIVIDSQTMGVGDEELGYSLMKAFIFAIKELDELPDTIIFYNSGVRLACEGSPVIEDLRELRDLGVKILSCGTCLKYYELTDKLAVGDPTNMYEIVQTQAKATSIIRPS